MELSDSLNNSNGIIVFLRPHGWKMTKDECGSKKELLVFTANEYIIVLLDIC